MAKFDGWKIAKIVGIAATIVGGIVTTCCDIPDLMDAIKEAKTPELPGPTEEDK